jgi:hypothetical protein
VASDRRPRVGPGESRLRAGLRHQAAGLIRPDVLPRPKSAIDARRAHDAARAGRADPEHDRKVQGRAAVAQVCDLRQQANRQELPAAQRQRAGNHWHRTRLRREAVLVRSRGRGCQTRGIAGAALHERQPHRERAEVAHPAADVAASASRPAGKVGCTGERCLCWNL